MKDEWEKSVMVLAKVGVRYPALLLRGWMVMSNCTTLFKRQERVLNACIINKFQMLREKDVFNPT